MCAALQLSYESKQITPSLETFHQTSGFRRLRIGLARVLLTPTDIRSGYPRAVRRFGLAGGYIARGADLFRRHGPALRRAAGGGGALDADLANFAARQALSAWLRAQER